VMTGEDVTADERRWRHIQHAMVACCAGHGPDVDELRQDVLDACPHNCAARRAVDQAFACDLSDVHSVRQRLVPFLLDPGAGCSTMPCVRDRVMRVVAGYVLTVGAAWLEVQPDTVSASTLQLPATSRVRAYLVSIGALGGVRAGPVSAGSAGATPTPLGFPARIIHRKQQRTDTDTEVLVGRPSKRSKPASHEQARMPSSQNVGLGMALPQA
jgi:hypothetical protein